MYDRPDASELIDAVRMHLEQAVIPAVRADRKLYFQTLVAINVLRIVERELDLGADHARAEWARLNRLESSDSPTPETLKQIQAGLKTRNQQLASAIRAGEWDAAGEARKALFAHVKASAIEQLMVANPRFLGRLQQEEADPTQDAWVGRNELR